ncbi:MULTISPECIES: hypothetical protein [unclassified Streptomyces]|uniref:hypothetical protein n=1 Tax=unclassified Streptomyces TaxID=2593676 RepID=UPI00339FA5AE
MGMRREEVNAVLAAHGFTIRSDGCGSGGDPVRFTKEDAPTSQTPVECHFPADRELARVLVDGRPGPRVTCEGIRLIGRVPSQLAREREAHALKPDTGLRFGPTGDLFRDGFRLEIGAQRAGDHVVPRALFFVAGEDHSVTRDAAPEAVGHR